MSSSDPLNIDIKLGNLAFSYQMPVRFDGLTLRIVDKNEALQLGLGLSAETYEDEWFCLKTGEGHYFIQAGYCVVVESDIVPSLPVTDDQYGRSIWAALQESGEAR